MRTFVNVNKAGENASAIKSIIQNFTQNMVYPKHKMK